MPDLLLQLAEGDMRTTGASDQVARKIIDSQKLFDEVFVGLYSNDPGLRMRCADAIEKSSAHNPALLAPHRKALLNEIGKTGQQEVQWHVAQVIPRLELTAAELDRAIELMKKYFNESKSNIVRVSALQTICDLATKNQRYIPIAGEYLQKALSDPARSLQARARKLSKNVMP